MPRFSVAIITDVDVKNPREIVADLHADSPGLPILVAVRNGGGVFASDALVAGAAAYVPLDDGERLRDRLERLLDVNTGLGRFFDHLVENSGVGVGAYGRDGVMTYVNPAYADLLGRTPAELRGLNVWDVNPDVDEDSFQQYFDTFAPGETRHADARHVRSDGSVVPVHTVSTCVLMGRLHSTSGRSWTSRNRLRPSGRSRRSTRLRTRAPNRTPRRACTNSSSMQRNES